MRCFLADTFDLMAQRSYGPIMNQTRIFIALLLLLILSQPVTAQNQPVPAIRQQRGPTVPKHLELAKAFVAQLDLANTNYQHGPPEVSFNTPCQSHADCSGFIDALLQSSYGYTKDQFKKWFDSSRPSARRYHDAIVEQTGFSQIRHVQDIQPGDFLAVKYLKRTDNTGHVMLVAGNPIRIQAKPPLVTGMQQWSVEVIDSSESGHGATDTRHARGPNGKDHDGVGEGIFRIYSNGDGDATGFAWSLYANSKFEAPDTESLVIGRLQNGFQP
jgi:hypothetical protein